MSSAWMSRIGVMNNRSTCYKGTGTKILSRSTRYMMQQSCEPLLFPFPRHPAHAAQSLGHPFPALCRLDVGLRVVLLGLPPSLHHLRQRFPFFVRLLHRYYAAVRLLHCVHVRIVALHLR